MVQAVDKNIIMEINRMREMMSLEPIFSKSKLIIEALNITEVLNPIINRLANLVNSINDTTPIRVGDQNYYKQDFENLIYVLEDFNARYKSATGKTQKLLGKFFVSEGYSEQLYIAFLNNLEQYSKTTETDLFNDLQTLMRDRGLSFKEALRKKLKNDDYVDLLVEGMEPFMNGRYLEWNSSNAEFVPTLKRGTPFKKLTTRQKKMLVNTVNDKTPSLFVTDFFELFWKSVTEIKKEIQLLNEGFIRDVAIAKRAKSDANIEDIQKAYAAQVTRKMNLLRIKSNESAATIMSEAGLSRDITDMIKNGDFEFFKLFRETWESDGETLVERFNEINRGFMDDARNTAKNLVSGTEKFKTFVGIFWPPLKGTVNQFLYTTQFASLNKQWVALIRSNGGSSKKAMTNYSFIYLAQSFVGYYIGWAIQTGILAIYEVLLGLFAYIEEGIRLGFSEITDNDKYSKDQWIVGFFSSYGGFGSFIEERLKLAFSFFYENDDSSGLISGIKELIEKMIVGGFGTVQEAIIPQTVEWTLNKSSRVSTGGGLNLEFEEYGIVDLVSNAFRALIPGESAEIIAYKDTIESFENFAKDSLDTERFNINRIEAEEGDDGKTYYKVEGKGNQADGWYYYKDDTFVVP
jgi:hypothetical protein